jgi:hypothetical protein
MFADRFVTPSQKDAETAFIIATRPFSDSIGSRRASVDLGPRFS